MHQSLKWVLFCMVFIYVIKKKIMLRYINVSDKNIYEYKCEYFFIIYEQSKLQC